MSIGSLELNPTFSSEETSYTAETSNKSNTIRATADDSNAQVSITLTNSANTDKDVSNGSTVTWAEGENTLSIKVSNGGSEKVYTVVVTKA